MYLKLISCFFLILINFSIKANDNRLIIATTTSTNDTGFLDYINEEFNKEYKISIHVLVLGTGQALKIAEEGNADLVIVHHMPSEIEFVNKGYGVKRYNFMFNDFIIIGPKKDKDKCNNLKNTLRNIMNNKKIFISRGDQSGTHRKEIELWESININPNNFTNWYKSIGQGMGATLMMANQVEGYAITDRGTWISFNNKNNLKIICENHPPLLNQYGIIAVNPKINSNVNNKWASIYISWLISEKGKKLINDFKINNNQIFFYNYK